MKSSEKLWGTGRPRQSTVGLTVDQAMAAIERDNPVLKDVLARDYARPALDKQRLGQLIDLEPLAKLQGLAAWRSLQCSW